MPELPWRKWYPQDWLADPKLSRCHPETRGIWADLLSAMMLSHTGRLTDTLDGLARLGRCTPEQMERALEDLNRTGAAEAKDEQNGSKTVANRRLCREFKVSELRSKCGSLSKQNSSKSEAKAEAPSASASASASVYASSSLKEGECEGEGYELVTPYSFGASSPELGKYGKFIQRLKVVRPEFRVIRDFSWHAVLDFAKDRLDIVEQAVTEFEQNVVNQVNYKGNPVNYFRGFLINTMKRMMKPSELYEFQNKHGLDRSMFLSKENR